MSDDVPWRDRYWEWRHRLRVVGAWITVWRALGWRRRSAFWVAWSGLNTPEQRALFLEWFGPSIFQAYANAAAGERYRRPSEDWRVIGDEEFLRLIAEDEGGDDDE